MRVLADTSQQLWYRSMNQASYRPSYLPITHMCFYAVHSRLTHAAHQEIERHAYNLDDNQTTVFGQTPTFERTSTFQPETPTQMVSEVTSEVHPEHVPGCGPEQDYLSRFFAMSNQPTVRAR